MNTMRLRSLTLYVLALGCAFSAGAQEKRDVVRDYDFVKSVTPVLNLSNPAALAGWDGKIAQASAGFEKANGGLIPLTQSKDSYEVSASTESYYRVSDKIAFFGHIDWSYFEGKEMGGPILLDPEYNPVNFYENDATTVGTKQRESYSLKGTISYNFSDKWAAGVSVKFDGRDQTKLKDPRSLTYWTDLAFDAGVSYRPSSSTLVGASAFYRNTLEAIQGGIYGKTDQSYFYQIDRGGFFGTVAELVGTRGALSPSDKRNMNNNLFGGAIQFATNESFFTEITFTGRDGYYGRKSSGSAVFFEFAGYDMRFNTAYLICPSAKSIHRIGFSVGYAYLANEENDFEYVTPTGGVTRVEYTGKKFVMDRSVVDGTFSYRWFYGMKDQRPSLTVGADFTVSSKQQQTEIYPFYRNQQLTRFDADVFATKDICLGGKSILNIGAHGLFHTGSGTAKKDLHYAQATSPVLKSFDMWLDPQFEYDTATRAGGLLSVEWLLTLDKVTPYVRVSDTYTALMKNAVYMKGNNRNVASVTLGILF